MQVEPGEDAADTFLAAFNTPNQACVTELLINELRAHPEGPGR